jgi:hypothetical protein
VGRDVVFRPDTGLCGRILQVIEKMGMGWGMWRYGIGTFYQSGASGGLALVPARPDYFFLGFVQRGFVVPK